ncbi:hypothetical protein HU200_059542 [Digitaria exilis]|uniref:Endonuclease/exonuclease/phosphatase domain-containing protein n=1 Tax=Digitaria exilis TaxID=1010633 RepID=A0A835AE45_9POAL|nr:hypothetical protein HU200_059542 [Digitaria exilis]
MLTHNLSFLSWNVRGLGQSKRYEDVLSELITQHPSLVALQETKLTEVPPCKRKMFLPSRLTCFATRQSDGAAGGILTAWDARVFSLYSTDEREFSLTIVLTLLSDGASLTITNVYAPTARSEKIRFLAELETIAAMTSGPWMIIGDFNLTRSPTDKNKGPFNHSEAHLFNDTINTLALLEIPLVDRAFTWSNKRDNPTLVRLDRCFINLDWDAFFPNTCLTSLTRATSDHVPLLLSASNSILKCASFWFENSWIHYKTFRDQLNAVIDSPYSGHLSKSFVARLKACRKACRSWAQRIRPLDQREHDTKALLDALDWLEELRSLTRPEATLRRLACEGLHEIKSDKLA